MSDKDVLAYRLEAIEKAQQRTRKAFFLALVASCIVILCAFNVTVSQSRRPQRAQLSDDEEYKLYLKAYVERWSYSVPILGISVSLEDFGLFGPLSLFIFSFYYVSCSRNTVQQLEDLSRSPPKTEDERQRTRIALVSEVVLNTSVDSLASKSGIGSAVAKGSLQHVNVSRTLLFAPFVASLAALLCDFYYAYGRREYHRPGTDITCNYFQSLDRTALKLSVIGFDITGAGICLVVLFFCLSAKAYSKTSESHIADIYRS